MGPQIGYLIYAVSPEITYTQATPNRLGRLICIFMLKYIYTHMYSNNKRLSTSGGVEGIWKVWRREWKGRGDIIIL